MFKNSLVFNDKAKYTTCVFWVPAQLSAELFKTPGIFTWNMKMLWFRFYWTKRVFIFHPSPFRRAIKGQSFCFVIKAFISFVSVLKGLWLYLRQELDLQLVSFLSVASCFNYPSLNYNFLVIDSNLFVSIWLFNSDRLQKNLTNLFLDSSKMSWWSLMGELRKALFDVAL